MQNINLKLAKRSLLKNKLNASINILGLSVSLTVCIFIALYVRDEISFDRHFIDHERIYRIAGTFGRPGVGKNKGFANTSYLLEPILKTGKGIDYITRLNFSWELITIGEGQRFQEQHTLFADSSFFNVFSAVFIQGNPTTALSDPNNIVIDKPTANKFFKNEDAMGKAIQVREKTFIVSAVIESFPENTHFKAQLIIPISGIREWLPAWVTNNITGRNMYTYFKASPHFSELEFENSVKRIIKPHYAVDEQPFYFCQPLTSIHLESNLEGEIDSNGSKLAVYFFSLAALIILVLASVNYVNLSTAAALERARESGVKKVLGATTAMLVKQFQAESLLVTVMSAVIAMFLAQSLIPFFNELSGKTLNFNSITDPLIVPGLLLVTLMIGIVAGSISPIILLRMGTLNLITGKYISTGKSKLRSGLIVFQFCATCILIASSLVITDQITFMREKDLGIDADHVVLIPLQGTEISKRFDLIKTEMSAIPSIVSIGGSNNKVTERVSTWRPYIIDWKAQDKGIPSVTVSYDFFETMNATLSQGRFFSKDFATDLDEAYVVNESAAKLIGMEHPVGEKLFGFTFTGSQWFEKNARIIGVVKDFNFASLHTRVQPTIFTLASDKTESLDWIEVRVSNSDISETIKTLEQVWNKVAPEKIFQFEFMEEALDEHYKADQKFLGIFKIFSALSIMLGGLGLFGLAAFMTKRRTREIGIRKIMGASALSVITVLSKDFLKLILAANILGWPISFYLMKNWLQTFAYQTSISAFVYLMTGATAVATAIAAIAYHSLKATATNPVEVLRNE